MKWYRPISASKELNNKFGMLATFTILALGLSIVAIIFALGGNDNATAE